MYDTRALLRAVKQRHGLTSDYQLAKFLNVSRQRISGYQSGAVTLGDEAAMKVADALGIERGRALAIVAAERAQSDQVKKEWLKLAAAVAVLLVVALPYQLAAAAVQVCILCKVAAAALVALSLFVVRKFLTESVGARRQTAPQHRATVPRMATLVPLIVSAAVLSGCATFFPTGPVQRIEWRQVDGPALAKACSKYIGEGLGARFIPGDDANGCYRRAGDTCIIYTRAPTSLADDELHRTLGHEARHCFEGSFH